MGTKDYYECLGVSRDASESEIARAFRLKAHETHPDVCTESDAEERFKAVNEAYEVLSDPQKKAMYDQYGTVDSPMADDPDLGDRSEGITKRSEASTFTEGSAGSRKSKKMIIAIAVVVLLLAAGGGYAYFEIQERDAALGRLAQATELLASADRIVIDVDAVVRGDITPELGVQASAAATAAPTAVSDLQEAIELLRRIQDDLPTEQAQEARALIASAEGRLEMLEHAPPILQANVVAAASLEPARAAWEHVSAAEDLKDQATTEYNRLTRASVTRSQQLNTQAEELFKQAAKQFSIAEKAFPEAELARFIAYVEANLELLAVSKKADAAFLAGRIAEANTLAAQVNTKDAKIVEQLKALPETPEAAIAGAYEQLAGAATELYFAARGRVTEADAELERLAQ